MRDDPDVLVIGGGVVGLFCAYYLRRAGGSVVVVERDSIGGPRSCSHGNTGFIGTQGAAPLTEGFFRIGGQIDDELRSWLSHLRSADNFRGGARQLLELKQRSLDILQNLGLDSVFASTGVMLAFKTPQGFEKACRSGVPMRILVPDEIRALQPEVEFDIFGALYNQDGGFVHSPDFVLEFARLLMEMGVEICEQAVVSGFEVKGARVSEVHTSRGEFRPQETVIAAGAWSARCARLLGIGLAQQPVTGYSVTVKAPHGAPRVPVLLSEGHVAVAPLGDRLRFGGVMELSGLEGGFAQSAVDELLHTVHAYLPRLEHSEDVEVWQGLRSCTPDSLPFLGRAEPLRNVSIACGHGHIGMGIAPVSGRLIAQLLAGEPTEMDLEPFRIGRYEGVR
jgi:D-amino-acid dehydrogenase